MKIFNALATTVKHQCLQPFSRAAKHKQGYTAILQAWAVQLGVPKAPKWVQTLFEIGLDLHTLSWYGFT